MVLNNMVWYNQYGIIRYGMWYDQVWYGMTLCIDRNGPAISLTIENQERSSKKGNSNSTSCD
jgi:hypothetical protein